jgi:hypothetical protein
VAVQPEKWTLGVLVNNLWSVAGSGSRPDVNSMTLQYFINYNLKKGYYLTSAPINSANWNAPSGNVWVVPVGGGIGRIMRLGFQPVNISVQAYGNARRPDTLPSPPWQLKFSNCVLVSKVAFGHEGKVEGVAAEVKLGPVADVCHFRCVADFSFTRRKTM